ncbi:MAG: GGDEF domain-containing phosphodiesterase [Bacilli bacterium]|nr:GGDEF domain-containing phosphodiesterase [Bacilli bacterium]
MFLQMTDETYMMIFFGVIIVTIAVTTILIFRVRKEKRRFKEEQAIILEGLLTKTALVSSINTYLAKITSDIAFSLLYIDIDNYADIINAFGNKDAVRALEKVAYHISHNLPKRVQMANYKSTQFLIFMRSEYDRFQCLELAKNILAIIKKPVKIYHDISVQFTGSIGICFYPAHGRKFNQLMNSLQLALQSAKKQGNNNFAVYSSTMTDGRGGDVEYHYDIKKAMENKEFELYYQPIINVATNQIFGAEALVRWNHPKHGVLTPVQFINTMEQTGDINWIGTWGVESLTQEYLELKKRFPDNAVLFNMNLSPKQMMEETLPQEFLKIVRKYNLTPDFICLEISDFSLAEKTSIIKQNLYSLKKVGFKLAINGFGLDYTALSALERMPIDIIKLDRHFFENESFINTKIADLIIDFARKHRMMIISEGIETEEMLKMVCDLGIDLVQGYYFSQPVLADNLREYIEGAKWKKGNDEEIVLN